MDATGEIDVKRALSALGPEARAVLINKVKAATGGYELDAAGNYLLSDRVALRDPLVRETEQLVIPTILAGRVPLDNPEFAAAMAELHFTEEDILRHISFHLAKPAATPEKSPLPMVWWGLLGAAFILALMRTCYYIYR